MNRIHGLFGGHILKQDIENKVSWPTQVCLQDDIQLQFGVIKVQDFP